MAIANVWSNGSYNAASTIPHAWVNEAITWPPLFLPKFIAVGLDGTILWATSGWMIVPISIGHWNWNSSATVAASPKRPPFQLTTHASSLCSLGDTLVIKDKSSVLHAVDSQVATRHDAAQKGFPISLLEVAAAERAQMKVSTPSMQTDFGVISAMACAPPMADWGSLPTLSSPVAGSSGVIAAAQARELGSIIFLGVSDIGQQNFTLEVMLRMRPFSHTVTTQVGQIRVLHICWTGPCALGEPFLLVIGDTLRLLAVGILSGELFELQYPWAFNNSRVMSLTGNATHLFAVLESQPGDAAWPIQVASCSHIFFGKTPVNTEL